MKASLYERLGGANGIHAMVDDAITAHLANPLVKARFEAVEDLDHAKRMACDFFAAGTGGPETYSGKDMLAAHTGMNISEQEFAAVVEDILSAGDKHGLDEETKQDVLAILSSLKPDIVNV